MDCIKACSLEEVFVNITWVSPYDLLSILMYLIKLFRKLPAVSLKFPLQSLLSFLPEDTVPRVIVVKPEMPHPTPIRPNGTKASPVKPAYDPSLLIILEYATSLAVRDKKTTEIFGKEVADALQSSLRESGNLHPEIISRLGFCLFSLLHASNVRENPLTHLWFAKLTDAGIRFHTGSCSIAYVFVDEC